MRPSDRREPHTKRPRRTRPYMMSSNTMLCKFFAQGSCRNGGSCGFVHERGASSAQSSPDVRVRVACKFFAQGSCQNKESCSFSHDETINSPKSNSDSRARVLCKFTSRPGGCRNCACPYLHAVEDDGCNMGRGGSQDFDINKEKARFLSSPVVEKSTDATNRT